MVNLSVCKEAWLNVWFGKEVWPIVRIRIEAWFNVWFGKEA